MIYLKNKYFNHLVMDPSADVYYLLYLLLLFLPFIFIFLPLGLYYYWITPMWTVSSMMVQEQEVTMLVTFLFKQ